MAATAGAQTKISGIMQCNKPEPSYSIEVGDRPGHIMLLGKQTCAWTGPDMGGEKTKDHIEDKVLMGRISEKNGRKPVLRRA